MEQGEAVLTTHVDTEQAQVSDGGGALDSAATKLLTAPAEQNTSEPVIVAIAANRMAWAKLGDAVSALDAVSTFPVNERTDETLAAIVSADEVRDHASKNCDETWRAIWRTEPQTFGAVLIAMRYASQHADSYDGIDNEPDLHAWAAEGIRHLITTLPKDSPESTVDASAEYCAALTFEPWTDSFDKTVPTNDEWTALANPHLVLLRLASKTLLRDRGQLREMCAGLWKDEAIGRLVDDLGDTITFFKSIYEVCEQAQMRLLVVSSEIQLDLDAGRTIDDIIAETTGASEDEPPAPTMGHVPAPADAHPDAYGLTVNEDGAGAHIPPGSTVVVEPIPPEPRGLAVAYFAKGGTPSIWHIGDSFDPAFLSVHPDSEVVPQIELFDPVTGRHGYKDARSFVKLHRVKGVYVPADVREAFPPGPEDLPILDDTPDGCLEHIVRDATNYPVLRTNDVAIVDISKTALEHGALCLIAWEGSGERCSILQTNYRKMGSHGPVWCVDPINRPRGPGMMEKRQKRGGLLYASDGPYTPELLQPKIIGTVVGIRRSGHRVATGGRA